MTDVEKASAVDFEAEAKKLRRHFEFTEADLMANQSGVLSEKQMKREAKNERGGKTIGVVIGGCLLVGAVIFGGGGLTWMKDLSWLDEFIWAKVLWIGFGLIFLLVALALAAGGIFLIVSQFINRGSFKLLSIRGRARLVKGHGDRFSHVYYDLYINDQEFDGDGTMNKAIIEGAEYIVYYIEGVEDIMSVELVSAAA